MESGPRIGGSRLGSVVGDTYRLVRHIGSGGMSDVFAAEHVRLGKPLAVKLLRPDHSMTRRAAERLRREARAIAGVSSEYIVGIHDCGETDDGTPFLVMELLEGEDLRSLLGREGSLPVARAANLLLDACYGLAAAHERGVVHRDLKPENLFVARHASGEDWCKVLDFGVAKMEASQSTAPGAIVGTIRYMAPEQLADSSAVSPATDVYALGAIAYECLCGQPAHSGQTMQELMFQVMHREPSPLGTLSSSVPAVLADAVMQCLLKAAADRPTLEQLTDRLRDFSHRGSPAVGDTLADVPRSALSARHSPARLGWLAALLALGSLTLGWALGVRSGAPKAAGEAESARAASEAQAPTTETSSVPLAERPAAVDDAASVASAVPPQADPGARASAAARRGAAPPAMTSPAGALARPRVGKFDEANPYKE
ncbi:MAG TPA: serine/threonine-protein kinase [Polyangiaceae bacterium]|nr:serine/threonine-protein kinase [Polyangiaceae bacterium]